ncbi:MAG: hypothetical protein K6T59_18435 [Bryobacteraceae bacterium]|nr:hypothetical protein [Bryobacteraceae bacterium]
MQIEVIACEAIFKDDLSAQSWEDVQKDRAWLRDYSQGPRFYWLLMKRADEVGEHP